MTTPPSTPTPSSWIDRIALVITVVVGGAAALLAASHTAEMAVRTGAVSGPGVRAYLVPLAIEGSAATFGLLAARRRQAGLGSQFEVGSLALTLLLAMAVNASAAGSAPWPYEGVVLAASSPAVLALSIHGLLRAHDARTTVAARDREAAEARAASERDERERALAQEAEAARVRAREEAERERRARAQEERAAQKDRADVRSPSARGGDTAAPVTGGERERIVDEMLTADPEVTGVVVGERLGLSSAQGRRLLAAARGRAADSSAAA